VTLPPRTAFVGICTHLAGFAVKIYNAGLGTWPMNNEFGAVDRCLPIFNVSPERTYR